MRFGRTGHTPLQVVQHVVNHVLGDLRGDMKTWEEDVGVAFLFRVGLKPGHNVIDFGCGVGHYSMPAARCVVHSGTIYAIDRNGRLREKLRRKARRAGLANIIATASVDEILAEGTPAPIDCVLAYDVLHCLSSDERMSLYTRLLRLLAPRGFVSVYPKHISDDRTDGLPADVTLSGIIHELKAAGLVEGEKIVGRMSHDNMIGQGYVLNFNRAANDESVSV